MSEEFRRLEAYFARRNDADTAEQLLRSMPVASIRIEKFGSSHEHSRGSNDSYGMRLPGFASLYNLGSSPTGVTGAYGAAEMSQGMMHYQGAGHPDEQVLLAVDIPQSWAQRAAQVIEQQGGRLR